MNESNAVETKNKQNKKTKKKIQILVIIILILIIVGIVTMTIWGNKKEEKGTSLQEQEQTELKNKLPIYSCGNTLNEEKAEGCETVAFEIPTETENAKVITYDYQNWNFILYDDNGLKIYNRSKKESKKINLENEYDEYNLNMYQDGSDIAGLILKTKLPSEEDTDNYAYKYYNIEEDKILYDNKYDSLEPLNEKYIQANDVDANEETKVTLYIMDANQEKEIKTFSDAICTRVAGHSSGNGIIYEKIDGCVGLNEYKLMTENFVFFTDSLSTDAFDFDKEGNPYVLENNKVIVYDSKGRITKTYAVAGEVKHIFYDYYLTVVEDKLYIKDYNDFSKELGDWGEDYFYHYPISGYYNEDELTNENEKKAGYYFIVETDNKGEMEEGIEYYFNPNTKETNSWELDEIGGYAKPVLYLYPETKTKVTVNFEHEENLTTTYPKFEDSWEVTANPNGDLYDNDGKYYYGLYWEEQKNHEVSFDTGFYVTKDNAIDFLEEKLTFIGLNDKERNEFIMYWLPILEKNGQSVVYFELTEERESYNKLQITPTPDALLRVAIHVKKVNAPTKIKEQKLDSFERKGFTAVEWGGVLYK